MKTKAQRKQLRKQRRQQRRQQRSELQDSVRSSAAATAEPPAVDDDLLTRASPLVESSINEEERTIVATLTTEQPVPMFDRINYRGMVDEVLVARGGQFPEQLVMLDDHSRWEGSRSVFGSARSIALNNDRWRATLHFARNAGQHIDDVWELVRQKHLTDVSIGYRYGPDDYVDIPAGRSETIQGKKYTAGVRTLRVVTAWTAREVSTTPIGADDQAKIGRNKGPRGTQETNIDNSNGRNPTSELGESSESSERHSEMKKYLKWLHQRGLSESVTDQAEALAWAERNLAGDLLQEFATVCRADEIEFTPGHSAAGNANTAQPQVAASTAQPGGPQTSTQTADEIRAERERVQYIHQMADGVNQETVRSAIDEGWDTSRINREFANAQNREERSEPLAPAVHSRSSNLNLRTLQAVVLMRSGLEIDNPMFRSREASHVMADRMLFGGGQRSDWICNFSRSLERGGSTVDDQSARAIDDAWQYRRMSMIDVCRAAMEIEGQRFSNYDPEEIIQRSFSTATLNAVFTTNFAAQLLQGFVGAPDTTMGWTSESDLPNFQTVERIQMHKLSRLKRTDKNLPPADAEAEAVVESYKLHRYSERFTVDEMDIIDDRFGALDMTPMEMGEAAREIRPDLVYSILLGNPTMGQDSNSLFDASNHSNLTASGAALSHSTLAAAKSAMAQQTSNGRLCNIRGQYLIVPESKDHTAQTIVGSAERRDTTSSTEYGTMNWARGRFTVVPEPRLDVGVTDPSDDSSNAGQAGSWFLSTANGRYGIEVGHLRGTGRAPVIRRYQLQEGRIGLGWLVIMYNAAKAVGYQGLYKSAE